MATLFLQESEATVLLADIFDFTELAKKKGATVELAITLSRFYEHIADVVRDEGGRVIKLVGDGVLCAFVGVADHRARALRAMHRLVHSRAQHNESARLTHMPEIDYSVVCASGRVLAGDLGAAKLGGFDVIGATVNRAFRLSHTATKRRVSNLVEASTYEGVPEAQRPAAQQVEAADLDGEAVQLYELA